jgi:hypothetical protein
MQVLTLRVPFCDEELYDVPGKVCSGQRPDVMPLAADVPASGAESLQKLMHKCWAQEPSDRPQTHEVRRHCSATSIAALMLYLYNLSASGPGSSG